MFFPTLILYFVCFFRPIGNFFGSLCFVCENSLFPVLFLWPSFIQSLGTPCTSEGLWLSSFVLCKQKRKAAVTLLGLNQFSPFGEKKNPKRSLDPISKKWNFLIKFWIWIIFGSRLKPLYLLDQVLLLGQNWIFGSKCMPQTKMKYNILMQNEFLDQNQFSLQSLFNL